MVPGLTPIHVRARRVAPSPIHYGVGFALARCAVERDWTRWVQMWSVIMIYEQAKHAADVIEPGTMRVTRSKS